MNNKICMLKSMNHFELHVDSIYPMPKRHLVWIFWTFSYGDFFLVDICVSALAAAGPAALAAVAAATAHLCLGAVHHVLDPALHLHEGVLGLGARLRDETVDLLERARPPGLCARPCRS